MKVFFCTTLLFFISVSSYCQAYNINKVIPNAPSTSKLEKVLSPEINEFKGTADITIPIYTINVDEVSIPIYLTYDTSGIKVEEESGWVGQSWSLITGGMVTRNQVGIPDEMKTNIGFSESVTIVGNDYAICSTANVYDDCGWFYSHQKIQGLTSWHEGTGQLTDNLSQHLSKINKGAGDTAPDIFNVFLPNGKSERFFFENPTKINFFDKGSIKVNFSMDNIGKGINAFIVRDITGTKYEFSNIEYLRHLKDVTYTNSKQSNTLKAYTVPVRAPAGDPNIWTAWNYANATMTAMCSNTMSDDAKSIMDRLWPKAWYVTKIRTIKGREIRYNYIDENYYSLSNTYLKNNLYAGTTISTGNDLQKIIQPRLESIVWDEGKIIFEANATIREDVYHNPDLKILSDTKALKKIKIFDNNNKLIKEYIFNQSYNLADGYNTSLPAHEKPLYKRLFLDNLHINDGNGNKISDYKFIYNNGNLPNRFSYKQDYWGYYNNNSGLSMVPALWWYPEENLNLTDKGPFSLYPRPTYVGVQKRLSEYMIINIATYDPPVVATDRRPNPLYTQNKVLKTVIYPTGGELNLEYEQNKFLYHGMDVDGPGIRVKKTILKENANDTNSLITEYLYEEGGKTSGRIREIPYFTGLGRYYDKTWKNPYYNISTVPLNQFNVNYNGEFGYTRVEKIYSGGNLGKEVKRYSFPVSLGTTVLKDSYQNYLFTTAIINLKSRVTYVTSLASEPESTINTKDYYPYPNETILSLYHGKLLETTVYGKDGNILKENKFTYGYSPTNTIVKALFVAPTEGVAVTSYLSSNFQLTENLSKDLYDNGKSITLKKNYSYDEKGLLSTESYINSKGEIIKTQYDYPYSSLFTLEPNFSQMKNVNAIEYPIVVSKYINDKLTDKVFNSYTSQGNTTDLINPIVQTESFKLEISEPINNFQEFNWFNSSLPNFGVMDSRMQSSMKVHKYDLSNGNVLEFSKKDDIHTVLIWGYKKTKVIAKLDNITYNAISSSVINTITALSDSDSDNCTLSNCKEQLLRVALNNLRNSYPEAAITTYTYDPLVDITSITDERGKATFFEYDEFQRLIQIKDDDGNILSQNKYHYSGQN